MVPLIETTRLKLRSFVPDDLDAQSAMMADPRVVRHLGATPFSREETWRKMLCAPGLWAMLGYGYWAVERRSDSAIIGQVGFADFKRSMTPSIEGLPEIGWILSPEAEGQGYALEAATASLTWADRAMQGQEIVAIIDPDNERSIRLAQKIGLGECEEALYRDKPILLFRRRPGASDQGSRAKP